ncbi:MAG: hypothetical protein OXI12_09225, partial [Gammaproteobacteria bacterium]|nr:hypothetical protein [Gammaproteobacteria bacterium]
IQAVASPGITLILEPACTLCSRFDRWLRLHSTKGFAETGELLWPDRPGTGAGIGERRMLGSDADTLIERVEDLARRESKSAERWLDDMIERQRRAGGRMHEAPGRQTTDYDRDLEDFDRDLRSRGR